MKNKKYLIFLIIPILLFLTGNYLNAVRGPNYTGFSQDPNYMYLLNGLCINQNLPVLHIDNPGTPTQILQSISISILGQLSGAADIPSDVLTNPELYLNFTLLVMLIFNASLIAIIGVFTYRISKDIPLSLSVQLIPFSSLTMLYWASTKVSPEPLLLSCSLIFSLVLFLIIYQGSRSYHVLLFALATGLGIASKLTFIPLIVIPLIIFNTWKQKIQYVFGVIVSFYIFTQPIVDQYNHLFSWAKSILDHSGTHGTGNSGFIDLPTFIPNIIAQVEQEPLFFIVVIISVIILILTRKFELYSFSQSQKIKIKFLQALIFTVILQVAIVAKHPGPQYLVPILGLSPVIIFLIISLLKRHYESKNNYFSFLINNLSLITLIIITTIVIWQIIQLSNRLNEINFELLSNETIIDQRYPKSLVIGYYRSSSKLYALMLGNTFAGNQFTDRLNKLYPKAYFWDIWNARFSGWDSQEMKFQSILDTATQKVIIFQGTPFETAYKNNPNYKPKLPLKKITSGQNEALYLLNQAERNPN